VPSGQAVDPYFHASRALFWLSFRRCGELSFFELFAWDRRRRARADFAVYDLRKSIATVLSA
jgi:hypothetical protein